MLVPLLEKTTGNIFYIIGLGKDFRVMAPKAQATKAKTIILFIERNQKAFIW